MKKWLILFLVLYICSPPGVSRADDSFHSTLGGTFYVHATAGSDDVYESIYSPEARTISIKTYDNKAYAMVEAFNHVTVSGGQIFFSFSGRSEIDYSAETQPSTQDRISFNFVTSTPMYVTFGGYAQADRTAPHTNNSSSVFLAQADGTQGVVSSFGSSGPQQNNQYNGILPPGAYRVYISLNCEALIGLTESGSSEGSYAGYFTLTRSPLPFVKTGDPAYFAPSTALLNGTVNSMGQITTAWFEYGLTTAYDQYAKISLQPNNSTTSQDVSATVNGSSQLVYHYRIAARNDSGTVYGEDKIFTPARPYNTVQFTSTSYNVDKNALFAIVTVGIVENDPSTGVTVNYATQDGTGQAATDYVSWFGTLTWEAGDSQPKTFRVPLIRSASSSGIKTVILKLSVPTSAILGSPAQAILTIGDKGGPPIPTLKIGSITPVDGGIHLQCIGVPNSDCQIETSSDLSANSFSTVMTVTADAGGSFYYDDTTAAKQKFYRLIYPSPNNEALLK